MSNPPSYNKPNWIKKLNEFGSTRKPCFFLISYDTESAYILNENEIINSDILFEFNSPEKHIEGRKFKKEIKLQYKKQNFETYVDGFNVANKALLRGDSFLLNYTCETPIKTNSTLKEIFTSSKAKYKVLLPHQWVCFSPESFIKIKNNIISTFPMKGTISANIMNAEATLLNDKKEKAEHVTVVDLLRNDLSQIAKEVQVKKFRYLETIGNKPNQIIQCSSKISGKMPKGWQNLLGDHLAKLLPAGSITGAPKPKTREIIQDIEKHKRGFYTGIGGYFDGENLNSCVLIRFIEERNGEMCYKSGGGLTYLSEAQLEYEEVYKKIYVPVY